MCSFLTSCAVTGFLLFCLLIFTAPACSKNYSKEGNVLPEVLQTMIETSNCSPCPYYVQVVELKRDTYFMVFPKYGDSGIVCDWFGVVIYDANSIRITGDSELYSRILSQGKKKQVVFDCP